MRLSICDKCHGVYLPINHLLFICKVLDREEFLYSAVSFRQRNYAGGGKERSYYREAKQRQMIHITIRGHIG